MSAPPPCAILWGGVTIVNPPLVQYFGGADNCHPPLCAILWGGVTIVTPPLCNTLGG